MNWIDTSFAFEPIDKNKVSYFKDASEADCLIYGYHFSTLPDLIRLIDKTHGDLFTAAEKREISKSAFRNRPDTSLPAPTGKRDIVDFIYEF